MEVLPETLRHRRAQHRPKYHLRWKWPPSQSRHLNGSHQWNQQRQGGQPASLQNNAIGSSGQAKGKEEAWQASRCMALAPTG
jgi:hypothetical protein